MQKGVSVLVILLASLSLGVPQFNRYSDFSCMRSKDFSVMMESLQANISDQDLVLHGCNQQTQIYHIDKVRIPNVNNNLIQFWQNESSRLCSEQDGGIYSERLHSVTQFRIATKGESEKLQLKNVDGQMMAVMVFQPSRSGQTIDSVTLEGQYQLFLTPVLFSLSSPQRFAIEGCNDYQGDYELSNSGTISLTNVSKSGQCNSNYERFLIELLQKKNKLAFTNRRACAFELVGAQNYLNFTMTVRQHPDITGVYPLVVVYQQLDTLKVTITTNTFQFESCNTNTFKYSREGLSRFNLTNFQSNNLKSCEPDVDTEYIQRLKAVTDYSFDLQTQEITFYGKTGNLLFRTGNAPELNKEFPLVGNHALYVPTSKMTPFNVRVTQNQRIITFQFNECKQIDLKFFKSNWHKIYFSTFVRQRQSSRCSISRHQTLLSLLRQVTLLKFDSEKQIITLQDSKFGLVLTSSLDVELHLNRHYLLYAVGTDLDPIRTAFHYVPTLDIDIILMRGCNRIYNSYNITADGQIEMYDFVYYKDPCPVNLDAEYANKFRPATRFEFNRITGLIRLFVSGSSVPIFTTSEEEYLRYRPRRSLEGNFVFSIPDSDILPFRVTIEESITNISFHTHECNVHNFTLWKVHNSIQFSNHSSEQSRVCEFDNDPTYITKFKQAVSWESDSETKQLKVFDINRTVILTAQKLDSVASSAFSLNGEYIFNFPNSELRRVKVTIEETINDMIDFNVDLCSELSATFSKKSLNNLISYGVSRNRQKVECGGQEEKDYSNKIKSVTKMTLRSQNVLRFYNASGDIVIEAEQFSIIGTHNLRTPSQDISPISVTVTRDRFEFMNCNRKRLRYTTESPYQISFTDISPSQTRSCVPDVDQELSLRFKSVVKFSFNPRLNELELLDADDQIVFTSKESNRSQQGFPLLGSHTFYIPGSRSNPTNVQVTEDDFIVTFQFSECYSQNLTIYKHTLTKAYASGLRNQRKQFSCSSDRAKKLTEMMNIADILEYDTQSRTINMFTSGNHAWIFTNDKDQPLGLSGRHAFYLVGSDLSFIRIQFNENQVIVHSCRSIHSEIIESTITGTLKFAEFKPQDDGRLCQFDVESEYLSNLSSVTSAEYNKSSNVIRLFGGQSNVPIYTTVESEFLKLMPKASLVGKYSLSLPRSSQAPIKASIIKETGDRIFLNLNGCNTYKYQLFKFLNTIYPSMYHQQGGKKCLSDEAYTSVFWKIQQVQIDSTNRNIKFFDTNGETIITGRKTSNTP